MKLTQAILLKSKKVKILNIKTNVKGIVYLIYKVMLT